MNPQTIGNGARQIRPLQAGDDGAVVAVWHRSGRAVYTFLPVWQSFTFEEASRVFEKVIRPTCTVWVGTADGQIVAFLALRGSYVDRLFVDPAQWRIGWGTQLLNYAKTLSPDGLELHTHQANHAARKLYEHNGFKAVRFALSPPPELAPDVEYHWRPVNDNSIGRRIG